MISNNVEEHATKTTFYIDNGNKERMDRFVSSRKKTQFINKALDRELKKLEEKKRIEGTIKAISNIMQTNRISMSDGEAILLWKEKIPKFQKENGRLPDINSTNEEEKRMAEAIVYLQRKKRDYLKNKK